MAKFYYQIKGRRPATSAYGDAEWAWPPVFSGMVEAPDRKAAKAVVEEQYERQFPSRVLRKDMDAHEYLLPAASRRSGLTLRRCPPATNLLRHWPI